MEGNFEVEEAAAQKEDCAPYGAVSFGLRTVLHFRKDLLSLRVGSEEVVGPVDKARHQDESQDPLRYEVTLQRHFSTSTKFAHVESRFCGSKQRGKAASCTSTNPCARRACSRSVAVGL